MNDSSSGSSTESADEGEPEGEHSGEEAAAEPLFETAELRKCRWYEESGEDASDDESGGYVLDADTFDPTVKGSEDKKFLNERPHTTRLTRTHTHATTTAQK